MMNHLQLELCLDELLASRQFKDYSPNGLQVEGRAEVQRIVTGVTACQALLDEAVRRQADAVLVHHGYFWGNEAAQIRGMKKRRLQTLLRHDINLYAYHLPLDAHPVLGNNAQLANLLGISVQRPLEVDDPRSLGLVGELDVPLSGEEFAERLAQRLTRQPLFCPGRSGGPIRRIAWCSGGGQSFIGLAAEQGIDAFMTGEASEQTIHVAREMGIDFFAAGHHATERYGVQALGHWLATEHGLDVSFVDIDNPV